MKNVQELNLKELEAINGGGGFATGITSDIITIGDNGLPIEELGDPRNHEIKFPTQG